MLQPVVQSIEGTKALLSQRFFFCRFPAISVITATMLRPFYPSALEAPALPADAKLAFRICDLPSTTLLSARVLRF
jgi:hypothetical protein